MTLKDLQHGQEVRFRTGRSGEHAVQWSEWATGHLHLRRRDKTYKRGREVFPAGEIVELAIVERPDWATYIEEQYEPKFNEWLAEDYSLQIEGLGA